MATEDDARKVPVKKGSAGAAKRVDPRRRPRAEEKPSKEDLDRRQERMRPTRRRGPVLREGEGLSRTGRRPVEIPETECDEPDDDELTEVIEGNERER